MGYMGDIDIKGAKVSHLPEVRYCSKCGALVLPKIIVKRVGFDQCTGKPIRRVRARYKCRRLFHDRYETEFTNRYRSVLPDKSWSKGDWERINA